MKQELLHKYLTNRCSEEELKEVVSWIETDALSNAGKKLAYSDWENYSGTADFVNDKKSTVLFDKIRQKIDTGTSTKSAENGKAVSLSLFTTWLTRAAAILLIPVLAFLYYTHSEKKVLQSTVAEIVVDSLEVIAPIGSRTVVQLSDGSKVHLNFGSKMKYPQYFSGKTREIELDGEGYFEVAHNPDMPFVVRAGSVQVTAVGTEFNVLAYRGDTEVKATLVNGKVLLAQEVANGESKSIGTMVPGQHVVYNTTTGAVKSIQGNIEKYIGWIDGKLIFEDTPISEVAEKLSRMFNVDIQVDDSVKDFIYTVTFVDEPLFQILDLMAIATPVKYRVLPRKKLADGTYSMQTIIIEKK
ncbi:FecR family protein [Maribellus sediminis]|uniref:FecR family protein n=1 Tax=Maribellus sediminis TaxID=2696285 RepID=UPI001430860C|nr:FecR domain-containing protein [Maribellus sediminis]